MVFIGLFLIFFLSITVSFQGFVKPHSHSGIVLNDASKLNPIPVKRILVPTTEKEFIDIVKTNNGPIAIAGGRYSMGGQIATENATVIDMRQYNNIYPIQIDTMEITVQTGATWRQILEYIDPFNLSVSSMQSYAAFTVGGSLSVNIHGRHLTTPLVHSVRSMRIVLADGNVLNVSRETNSNIFYGAIGGYGGLGVIVEATLILARNVKIEQKSIWFPFGHYMDHFDNNIRPDHKIILQNADLYPPEFDEVKVTTYRETDKSLTIHERLRPKGRTYILERILLSVVAASREAKYFRGKAYDRLKFGEQIVEWRNYEESYDIREIEPFTRADQTFVLQEYFVPKSRLNEFVFMMKNTFLSFNVNVVNVSIRFARADVETFLAWARSDVFALVIYYSQGTSDAAKENVTKWTRNLIDAALSVDGCYYLPYQIHATKEQFHQAYPRAIEFFELKRKVDPKNKFRNKLFDAYMVYPDTQ